jgi:hypothetical protein
MEQLAISLSENFTKIILIDEIINSKILYWGGNGVGDRWCGKIFNYSVIYSNKTIKTYSENNNEILPDINTLNITKSNRKNIIGIFIHSKRITNNKRPIRLEIKRIVTNNSCVICGSNTDIVCDHKNDLYNDPRVLDVKTQSIDDFQPLCNHCNLLKRTICKKEIESNKLYSAKNISRYKQYDFEFPWEKKSFNLQDISCKIDTYWNDPVEFDKKIYLYITCIIPIVRELKRCNF